MPKKDKYIPEKIRKLIDGPLPEGLLQRVREKQKGEKQT